MEGRREGRGDRSRGRKGRAEGQGRRSGRATRWLSAGLSGRPASERRENRVGTGSGQGRALAVRPLDTSTASDARLRRRRRRQRRRPYLHQRALLLGLVLKPKVKADQIPLDPCPDTTVECFAPYWRLGARGGLSWRRTKRTREEDAEDEEGQQHQQHQRHQQCCGRQNGLSPAQPNFSWMPFPGSDLVCVPIKPQPASNALLATPVQRAEAPITVSSRSTSTSRPVARKHRESRDSSTVWPPRPKGRVGQPLPLLLRQCTVRSGGGERGPTGAAVMVDRCAAGQQPVARPPELTIIIGHTGSKKHPTWHVDLEKREGGGESRVSREEFCWGGGTAGQPSRPSGRRGLCCAAGAPCAVARSKIDQD